MSTMFYELLIGFGVLLYLVWKYLLSARVQGKPKEELLEVPFINNPIDKSDEELIKPLINGNENGLSECNDEIVKTASITEDPKVVEPLEKISKKDDKCLEINIYKTAEISDNEPLIPYLNNVNIHNDKIENYLKTKTETFTENQNEGTPLFTSVFKNKDFITPSLLLKQQQEKTIEKLGKRESPPKERLTEFLEKTILNQDKIQNIIQNLSLDKEEPKTDSSPLSIKYFNTENGDLSKTSLKLQDSIDQITDRVKRLNDINFTKQLEKKFEERNRVEDIKPELITVSRKIENPVLNYNIPSEFQIQNQDKSPDQNQTECDGKENPILKRMQKQPGFGGLNFGSVIGELKNKTRNGNGNGSLKPVFKKFDNSLEEDDVDNLQDSLNCAVEDKKKVQIEDNELGPNILADRRNKLETAAQGWRKRVPQSDASLFTVAGRLERDKVNTNSPPLTPPPVSVNAPTAPGTPGTPSLNKFKSRKQTSPTNGFLSGALRSASCAVVSDAAVETKLKETTKHDNSFKRSHSVSDSLSNANEKGNTSPSAERAGLPVRVPRADDETFHAFFAPVHVLARAAPPPPAADTDLDLDAIDSGSRHLLAGEWARRAKRERKHAASRNPLRALAARTDIRDEYVAPPSTLRDQLIKEKATANCGLAAEALAALATKEDFSNVALRSAAAPAAPAHGTKPAMLLQVKGRRRVQTRLVEPIHTSVNRGDCYVLITPDQLFLYIGQYANVIERNRSTDIANHINNTKDLGCKNNKGIFIIDEQNKKYSNKHWTQFWSLLGVSEGVEDYKPIETGHPDEDEIFESCIVQTNMCYEAMDDELVPIKEYWGQLPKISMLNQAKTIVFDFGSEMYIWYGKNVHLESRRRSAQLAQELFDEGYNYEECHINPLNASLYQGAREQTGTPSKSSKCRPEWAILSKVTQHMETILFKEKFLDWPDYTRVIQVKPQETRSNSTEISPCDAEEMWSNEYQDPDLILEGSHVGRGTHYYDKESMRHYEIKSKSVYKWVIRENDYQKVENNAEIGEFFSGDSYIIRWEYQITVSGRELNGKPSKHNLTGRDRCAYFCWQGKDASSNEKGTAALLTVELDREKGPQLRVAQGNEPPAFLNLFQGNLVIHQGKRDTDKSRYKLFITRGNLTNEAYLLQVPCSVRQLRSRGSLLLVDTEKGGLYIWHGARSLKHTKNIAIELANKLIARKSSYLFGNKVSDLKITEVKEGEEPREVLEALGVPNKQYYNSVLGGGNEGKEVGAEGTPRLFHFTDLGGQFEANEVLSPLRHEHLVTPFPFEQKELYLASQPALLLLDGGGLWLWQGWWPRDDGQPAPIERNAGVGAFAARWQSLRAAALRSAEAYWRVSRGPAAPDVRLVAAGLEPQSFTDLFDTWADHDEAAEANIAHGYKAGDVLSGTCELSRLTCCDAVLPLAALQRRPLPEHVDPHHLERHLSPADFLEAFGLSKDEFSGLPAWKQTNLKKDVGLF